MNIKKHKVAILVFTIVLLGWISTVYYYEKMQDYHFKNSVEINGVMIDESILGTSRTDVIKKLGEPKLSALAIKGFDDYQYVINNDDYGLVIHYEKLNEDYFVSGVKFIKDNLKNDSRLVLIDIQE
ncbi:hypothetical protein [Moraxella nonliquefaciens]|jgi:hypothetical protein|uniref:Uncharacterized protein n=1 Tax=Moraxella nonliquefaciens TaxID=478 RepID=A0A1B8QMS1_MORNO|nr:hypothetical protein [Moraxella nonliquefaciens]OBX85159.1 hypothetical protein A7456_10380 [Moraxella nonliquefaciens]QPT45491.1 hypothetical protein I6G26_05815 [Moraxella nonliquefaciens]QQC30525.1 hypothetical protein I6H63_04610 [Moraxella nonliquefaciens]